MENNHAALVQTIKKAIERIEKTTKNQAEWEKFLKLQLIKEILATGKQQ